MEIGSQNTIANDQQPEAYMEFCPELKKEISPVDFSSLRTKII